MLKIGRVLIISCFAISCFSPLLAFERRIGARPMGMGDAFSALADDMNAMNYNPAGLAVGKNIEFSLEYANLYPGLDDGNVYENHLVYTQSLYDSGGFGLAWNNRTVSNLYNENEILFGYAIRPSKSLPFWIGLTTKLFYLSYFEENSRDANSYFADGFEKFQFALDVGAIFQILPESKTFPELRAGFSLLNVNQPDLGLRAESLQPMEIRIGTSAVYGEWDGALDLVFTDSQLQIHAGAEKWFFNRMWGTRMGVMVGEGTGLTWTMGGSCAFALSLLQMRLNYAFNYSLGGIQKTAGIHRVSLDFLHTLPTKEDLKRRAKERREREKIEFANNKQSAFELFSRTKSRVVNLENKPIYRVHPGPIDRFKADMQSAMNFMGDLKYKQAIQILNAVNKGIEELEQKYSREAENRIEEEKKQKTIKQARIARHKKLVRLVKAYLMKKILLYASTRQKIKQLRISEDKKYDSELYAAEQIIYKCREKIVVQRDIRGFLRELKKAVDMVALVEKKLGEDLLRGSQ